MLRPRQLNESPHPKKIKEIKGSGHPTDSFHRFDKFHQIRRPKGGSGPNFILPSLFMMKPIKSPSQNRSEPPGFKL